MNANISIGSLSHQRGHRYLQLPTGPFAAVSDGLGQLGPEEVVLGVGQPGELLDDAVVGDDGEVLLVPGDVGDGEADGGQHLHVARLQQAADQLEAAHEAPHHVARVGRVLDAGAEGPRRARL